jgi:RHS repeat-associated protein
MSVPPAPSINFYQYDPLDRLISAHSIQRFYNRTRIATEIQGERTTCFFEQGNTSLAEVKPGDTITLLATDLQKTVLYNVHPTFNLPQIYSPYGHRPAADGSLSLLGFTGERPDPVTGHYLLGQGYRAYNPVLMRFNNPDSFSPFGKGGINAYAYCGNDPINYMDPSGRVKLFFFARRLFNQSNISGALKRIQKSVGGIKKTKAITTPAKSTTQRARQAAASHGAATQQPAALASNRPPIGAPVTRSRELAIETLSTPVSNAPTARSSTALRPIYNYASPDQWDVQLIRGPSQPAAIAPIKNYAHPGSWEVQLAPDPMQPWIVLDRMDFRGRKMPG